jgi:hypothetical protein
MIAKAEGEVYGDNSLYRVEINAPSGPDGVATFIWSRDNGSVVLPIRETLGETSVRLESMRSDELLPNGWVQICDEDTSRTDQAPELVRVKEVDRIARTVTFQSHPRFPTGKHRFLRVWNQPGPQSALNVVPDSWIEIEHGIQVQFPKGQAYRQGDYWLIPFRAQDRDDRPERWHEPHAVRSPIEWPLDEQGNPRSVPAYGFGRRGCLLGLVENRDGRLEIRRDYRRTFVPLTQLASDEGLFVKRSADRMTGSLDIAGSLDVEGRIEGEHIHALKHVQAHEVRGDLLSGGLITGQLDAGIVDTPQLCDLSVTTEKIAPRSVTLSKLAFDIPRLGEGFSLLRDNRHPVHGYVCVNRLLIHDVALPWSNSRAVGRPGGRDRRLRAVGCGDSIYVISERSGEMWALDTIRGVYRALPSLPTPRRGFGLAELGGRIYVIGGFELHRGSRELTGSVLVYDTVHHHGAHHGWRESGSLNHPRAYLAAASAGGKIFALGGEIPAFLHTRRTAVCEFLEPGSGDESWVVCGKMHEPRSRFGVASHQGNLFVVGGTGTGFFGARTLETVEKLYPELIGGDWSCLLRPLPEPRAEAAVAFLEDRLFCVAGRKNGWFYSRPFTRDCHVFDPELNRWVVAPPISLARSKASLVAQRNTLYAIGGSGPAVDNAEVLPIASLYYVFDPAE